MVKKRGKYWKDLLERFAGKISEMDVRSRVGSAEIHGERRASKRKVKG